MPLPSEKMISLEEFVKELHRGVDEWAEEWKKGMAEQPQLFDGEMTSDDWHDQHLAMTLG